MLIRKREIARAKREAADARREELLLEEAIAECASKQSESRRSNSSVGSPEANRTGGFDLREDNLTQHEANNEDRPTPMDIMSRYAVPMLPLHVCETIQEEMDKNPEFAQEDYPGQRFVDHKAAEELMRKVMKQSRLDYEAEQAADAARTATQVEQAVRTAPAAAIIIVGEECQTMKPPRFKN